MITRRAALLVPLAGFLARGGRPATRACAHRGDVEHAPENTLPAIASAVRKKVPQIEFDVKFSRDGKLVLLHDQTIDRTSNGKGKVSDLTFAELRRLDFGSWFSPRFAGVRIPTLREILSAVPRGILLNVHLASAPGLAMAAARTLMEMGRADDAFLAATEEQAAEVRAVYPAMRICNMSRQEGDLDKYVERTIAMRAQFIQIRDAAGRRIPDVLAQTVDKLHQNGVTVNYFGAQEEDKIRALARAGVDYILTDKLDLCQRVLGTS